MKQQHKKTLPAYRVCTIAVVYDIDLPYLPVTLLNNNYNRTYTCNTILVIDFGIDASFISI